MKIDAQGNKVWDQTYGGEDWDYLWAIESSGDGGFLLVGESDSDASGEKSQDSRGDGDYWVIKVDSEGNK